MRARGLADHLHLLDRSGGRSGDLESLRNAALEQARTAYTEARGLLDQIQSRASRDSINRLKINVDAILEGM